VSELKRATYIGPSDDDAAGHAVHVANSMRARHHLLVRFRAQENVHAEKNKIKWAGCTREATKRWSKYSSRG